VTGATIDHMISLIILIAALLVAMTTYNQMFATAADYDQNRQVATKAADLMNTICLSPGNPTNWGRTASSLFGFGLQDPEAGGYALSPYSMMRLNAVSVDNPPVHFDETGLDYNNISTSYGHAILTPLDDCVDYTTATELLGINGSYGFSLDVTSTLNVNVSQVSTDPYLKLNVEVQASGMPLSGVSLKYCLFNVERGSLYPSIALYSDVDQTNSFGSVDITFSSIDDDNPAYSFVVYVSLGGVNGVGYYTRNIVDDSTFVVPLIEGYEGNYVDLILAHSGEILNPSEDATAYYNASFYTLTSDFQLQPCVIPNSAGILKSGAEQLYSTTRIPASETGLLVISYIADDELGSVIVPWGVGALGVPASFGGDPTGYDFVATELRQVTIDGISYHVKVSTWSLSD
jgi:hypothetical protein